MEIIPDEFHLSSKNLKGQRKFKEEKSRKVRRKKQKAEHKRFKSVVKVLRKVDFKTIRLVGNHRRFDFVI